jgi:hypothetical protein
MARKRSVEIRLLWVKGEFQHVKFSEMLSLLAANSVSEEK